MHGFTLARVPEIAAGAGRLAGLGGDVTRLAGAGTRVLLVADPALVALGLAGAAEAALRGAGHDVALHDGISSDPLEAQVAEGARLAERTGAAAVVGLGGGSALDAAKMIAALAGTPDAVLTYRLAAAPLPARRVVLIAVPTTAGTGAEVTSVSILSDETHTKYWFWSTALKPDLVLLDPELTVGLPPALTAATGLDALVHAIEAATNRRANPAGDVHALAAIRLATAALPRAVAAPCDLAARLDMLHAATLAGIAIENAGTALAHCIGHALGSLYGIHHGRAVAIGMAATLPFVVEGAPTAFGRVAEAMGAPAADRVAQRFAAFFAEVGFDPRLPAGVEPRALAARMAAPENAAMREATCRPVAGEDIDRLAEAVVSYGAGRCAA